MTPEATIGTPLSPEDRELHVRIAISTVSGLEGIELDLYLCSRKGRIERRARDGLFSDNAQSGGSNDTTSVKEEIVGMITAVTPNQSTENQLGKESSSPLEIRRMSGKTVILFLASDPTPTARLRLDKELREIQDKLRQAIYRDRFDLQQRPAVRPEDVFQALYDLSPHYVHFSAHGALSGEILLEDESGAIFAVPPERMAALFGEFNEEVKCVLLNTCFSEQQARAIAEHIEYTIGVPDVIDDQAAIKFVVGFYRALGAGRTIEKAYHHGITEMRFYGSHGDSEPMLFRRARPLRAGE